MPPLLDVSGPVQAELFVVWLNGERLDLTGPCGAAPWRRGARPAGPHMRPTRDEILDMGGSSTEE